MVFLGVVGDDLITVSFFSTGDCFAFFDSLIFDFGIESILAGFALFASFFLGFASCLLYTSDAADD